jgi:catechol 2,3-dioxygenase-like lactoylglutathione lyase family enzyme
MLKDAPIVPYIPASDLPRARRFYEQTLGFTPKRELPGAIAYDCGQGSWFLLYQSGFAGTNKASQAFWQVADVEKAVAELKGKGVRFEEYDMPGLKTKNGIAGEGANKVAWFKDSEGNILALVTKNA